MSALNVTGPGFPSIQVTTSVTDRPPGSVFSRSTYAPVSSSTPPLATAGSTHTTCASDFAPTRQGNPSTRSQRMHALPRLANPSTSWSRSTPIGRWNGRRPSFSMSSDSCWMRGSCSTGECA